MAINGFQPQGIGFSRPAGGLVGFQRQGMDQRKKSAAAAGGPSAQLLGITGGTDADATVTISNGRRRATSGTAAWRSGRGIIGRSVGVFYHEVQLLALSGNVEIGWADGNLDTTTFMTAPSSTGIAYDPSGTVRIATGNTVVATLAAFVVNDVIGLVLNAATKRGWLLKNGVALNGDPVALTGGIDLSPALLSGTIYPAYGVNSPVDSVQFNFSSSDFAFPQVANTIVWN